MHEKSRAATTPRTATSARPQTPRGEPDFDRVEWIGDGPTYRTLGFSAVGDVVV